MPLLLPWPASLNGHMGFDRSKNVRVILLKAAGKAFCVGIDVSEFSGKTVMEYRNWIGHMGKAMITMSRICKPVIASAHGMVTAIGAGLVAASDLAIVSEDAKFGLTAINVGLNCIGPAVPVARSVGRKRTLELLFFGDLIGAEKALGLAFVNRVVPVDQLEQNHVNGLKTCSKSPLALGWQKAFWLRTWIQSLGCMRITLRACVPRKTARKVSMLSWKKDSLFGRRGKFETLELQSFCGITGLTITSLLYNYPKTCINLQ